MWEQRYVYGSKEIPLYWYRRQPATEKAKIKEVGYIAIDKVGGSRGIKYIYKTKVENRSENDWMSFLQKKSKGLQELDNFYDKKRSNLMFTLFLVCKLEQGLK